MGAVGHAVQVGLARHHAEGVHVRRRCAAAAATQRRHRRAAIPPAARVVHEPERRVLAHALRAHVRTRQGDHQLIWEIKIIPASTRDRSHTKKNAAQLKD